MRIPQFSSRPRGPLFLMTRPSNLSPSAALWLSLKNWGSYPLKLQIFDRTAGPLMALPVIRWATVVTHIKAKRYRQFARDLHFMARSLPLGERRSVLLEMAEEWDRLADHQERSTDLRDGEHHGR